jgi:hypothetical protein
MIKNVIFSIILFLIFLFLGFSIGRYSDKYYGRLNTPHHWIWGLLLIALGIGLFISDLNDFFIIPFYSFMELNHVWKFWSIK